MEGILHVGLLFLWIDLRLRPVYLLLLCGRNPINIIHLFSYRTPVSCQIVQSVIPRQKGVSVTKKHSESFGNN